MDLSTAIKHILDGNAIILMGAGASYGVENMSGAFPSGSMLAADLYKMCGITPDDKNDLQDASQIFLDKYSSTELIQEIKARLTPTKILPCHTVIYSQPWMRYYTTNYDNVALIAAREKNVKITPITLNSNYRDYLSKKGLCIHINGHIDSLNEDTLQNEFKLTADSYLSEQYINNSTWGALLESDLEAASCIVILGLSLKYDLDLSRIVYNAEAKSKTIIIDKPDLTQNAEIKLSRYGEVYKIGVDGFADEIQKIAACYTPAHKDPVNCLYTCFEHEYRRPIPISKATPASVYNLFLCGSYDNDLFHKSNNEYDSFVYRSKFYDVHDAIFSGKKYIFIHADMGNGKTACVEELRFTLSKYDYHVFTLGDANITNLSNEILSICSIENPCVVIIENYTSYMDVLREFSIRSHSNIQFVFTARSALNFSKMLDVFDIFSIAENESTIIDLNRLGRKDIERCVRLFNTYGAWGKRTRLSFDKKCNYLKDRSHGNSKFQSIMIDVLKSEEMTKRISDLISIIREESEKYHNIIIIILIIKIMNLRLSASDIERITCQSIFTDAKFRHNPAIQELLDFSKVKKGFTIKSPVTSNYILREIATPQMIIDALITLAEYAVRYRYDPKYYTLLNDIISFSHIASFIKNYSNAEIFLAEYYDKLSQFDYYLASNFFWLQYAISCIEVGEFQRAQKYLDTAYGLVSDDFVPFQINNQQACLYLEMITKGASKDVVGDFEKAHKLLMLPITSDKDNEFYVVRLFGYYTRKEFIAHLTTDATKALHKRACKDAYNRVSKFISVHSEYLSNLNDLSKRLLNNSF